MKSLKTTEETQTFLDSVISRLEKDDIDINHAKTLNAVVRSKIAEARNQLIYKKLTGTPKKIARYE